MDNQEITRIKLEYQENKDLAKEWNTGSSICLAIGFILCVISPVTFMMILFLGFPFVLFSTVGYCIAEHYSHKTKRLKESL